MVELIIAFISYLPMLVLLYGLVLLLKLKGKSSTLWLLVDITVWLMAYYLLDALAVSPCVIPGMRFMSFTFIAVLAPFIQAFTLCLLWKIRNERALPWHYYLFFVVPISIAAISIMFYSVVDKGEAIFYEELQDRLHQFPDQFESREVFRILYFFQTKCLATSFIFYSLCIISYSVWSLWNSGFTWKSFVGFMLKRSSQPPMHLILILVILLLFTMMSRSLFGYYYILEHPVVNIIFSLLQAMELVCIMLTTSYLDYEECTLRQIFRLDPKEILQGTDEEDQDAADDFSVPLSPDDNAVFRQVQARLDEGLRDLMVEKHAFLDSELRLVDVARTLCTNRNYLSRHINERYGINFNEYLNRMRIRYSKQYMLDNPNQLLDQIAIECGFGTAQSFGRKFKAIEGVTPRTWMVNNRKK